MLKLSPKRLPFYKIQEHTKPVLELYKALLRHANHIPIGGLHAKIKSKFRRYKGITSPAKTRELLKATYEAEDTLRHAALGSLTSLAKVREKYTKTRSHALTSPEKLPSPKCFTSPQPTILKKVSEYKNRPSKKLRISYTTLDDPFVRVPRQSEKISMILNARAEKNVKRNNIRDRLEELIRDGQMEDRISKQLGQPGGWSVEASQQLTALHSRFKQEKKNRLEREKRYRAKWNIDS
ncbi:hypothetical protein NEOLI_003624 [Neolecta irregularis DAH-3]|uniref:Complex 1 LYR protein domain-containing protein n=1 Tax=Neolecta irregularis (strain DAH-3) TaxID=1198029 RepID=A0A1U7LHA4_NEOID|nr:hypothetical protein NEOLI_003624 [Neolecta irregularis DAH-3]|eukprot:OLL22008.1 hypothetical protein NEOLI_003624 [Neolecta irregularis DAH-3]